MIRFGPRAPRSGGVSGLLFFALGCLLPLGAQELTLSGLDEIAAYAKKNSLAYRQALFEAKKAYDALPDTLKLKSTTLTVSPTYSNDSGVDTWALTTSLRVPILDQIALTASLDEDLAGEVGLSLSPLSHSDTADQAKITYSRALLAAEKLSLSTESDSLSAALALMGAEREEATQEKRTRFLETKYREMKTRYDYNPTLTSLDEVREALLDWSEARSALSQAQAGTRQARSTFYTLLRTDPSRVKVKPLDLPELYAALEKLQEGLKIPDKSPEASFTTKDLDLNVSSYKAQLDKTWLVEPDLSINGGLRFDTSGKPIFNASLTLALSLDDFKGDLRRELETDLGFAREALEQERESLKFSYEQALLNKETYRQTRESREISLEQSKILADESTFLLSLGQSSELDVEEARVDLASAENALFSALADEYISLLTLRSFLLVP